MSQPPPDPESEELADPKEGYESGDDDTDNGDSHPPKLLAWWQRILIWAVWIEFAWQGWKASAYTSTMGWKEFVSLGIAIAVTVWCCRNKMGGLAVFIKEPSEMRGDFTSRTNWAGVLISAVILLVGAAALIMTISDWVTGRATIGEIFKDMGLFVIKWIQGLVMPLEDAELEELRGYILMILLVPGFFMVLMFILPWLHKGCQFRVNEDHTLAIYKDGAWQPFEVSDYPYASADGWTVDFKNTENGDAVISLPQARVFSLLLGTRVKPIVLAAYFREKLEKAGYHVQRVSDPKMVETAWKASKEVTSARTA